MVDISYSNKTDAIDHSKEFYLYIYVARFIVRNIVHDVLNIKKEEINNKYGNIDG